MTTLPTLSEGGPTLSKKFRAYRRQLTILNNAFIAPKSGENALSFFFYVCIWYAIEFELFSCVNAILVTKLRVCRDSIP